MPTTALRSVPCSARSMVLWPPSPATAPTTATTSMPKSRRAIKAAVVVPPRANAVPSKATESAPTRRDRHLQAITEHGRMAWQKASGYNWRALVEADISRWKRVIGNGLRFQTDGRQASEVAIAVSVLNRMLGLGRPKFVRIAKPGTWVGLSAPAPPIRATRCPLLLTFLWQH